MALFVVRHQHAAERCPAQDPYLGAMLLNHGFTQVSELAGGIAAWESAKLPLEADAGT